jgi:CubicO group peptidase (beta-lactamase class C family)
MRVFQLRGVSIALLTLITCSSCSTSNPTVEDGVDAEVDLYLETWMFERDIPGLSLAVLRDGKVVKLKGYGVANRESKAPATEDTVYCLASLTKPFTATAVMLLVEEGKLKLDDEVINILPGLPSTWKGITLYHLLTHTSGLPDCLNVPGYRYIADTRAKLIHDIAARDLVSKPGEKAVYIQTEYILLGAIIEQTSGQSFPEFMKQRLFDPLEMTRTNYGDDLRKVPGRDRQYSRWTMDEEGNFVSNGKGGIVLLRESVPYQRTHPAFADPCEGLHTTASDLAKWDAALSSGRLLKQSSLDLMWTATKGAESETGIDGAGYGCAWYLRGTPGHRIAMSVGGDATIYSRYLDDKLTVIILTNCLGAHPQSMAEDIATMYSSFFKKNLDTIDPN